MRLSFYFFFFFYSAFLLFYPGDSEYFKVFAKYNDLINTKHTEKTVKINPIPQVTTQTQPFLTAEGVYIADIASYSPIFEKNSHTHLLPASTTKVLTALVSRDVYKIDDIITVKKTLAEGQLMGLVPNERITVENLLYGMLVYSGNDAAYVLADNYGFDKFITLMNKKAASLGMKDSQFKNPAGLDDFTQYTTAFDLALASRELLKDPLLRKIVGTKEITISDVDYKIFHPLSNVNKLLGEIQGLGGLKTGYTENAGENLVSFYKHNDHQYLIVILKSQDRFADTRSAITWLENSVSYVTPSL